MPSSGEPGSGGPITSDGSVVEIYRRVSGDAEVQVIAAMLNPASSVLDLGSGAGRIANPLSELGHQLTAVDDSADMLAHVRPGERSKPASSTCGLPRNSTPSCWPAA
ncbi:tellurite resistance TehB family protein [Mycobacterium kansasii 732]|nr:tellurite resistance TehB family protein [Mycobacterium kansasii 732]